MQFLRNLICFLGLLLLFALPFGAIGAAASGISGGLIGAGLGLALFFVFILCAEWLVLRIQPGPASRGRTGTMESSVNSSFSQVLAAEGLPENRAPKLRFLLHPAPRVMVVRGWPSRGSICVSEGLLALLSEDEIRSLFSDCLRSSRAPGVRMNTFSKALISVLISFAQSAWIGVLIPEMKAATMKSPSSGLLRALVLLPWLKLVLMIGGQRRMRHGLVGPGGDAVRRKMTAPGAWQFGGGY